MHNHPLCGHFVEPSLLTLYSGESLAGPGCLCWKSNWTEFDHKGSTGGQWETISGSFSIPFGSYFFVECHTHTNKHCHCYWCHGLILSLDNWKEHTIPLHVICLLWRLFLQMLIFARNLQQVSASGHEACPSNARVQHPCKKLWKDNSLLIFFYPTCFQPLPLFSKRSHGSGGPVFASPGWRMFFLVFLSNKMENQLTFESLPV